MQSGLKREIFREVNIMKLSNKAYDIIKIIAILILPISEFISSMATIWGMPYGQQIVATLVALDVLMGTIVKIASDRYQKEANEE